MLTDFLDRMKRVLTPEIEARGGRFKLATDREDALAQGIMFMGAQWLVLLYLTGGKGGEYQMAIKGYCEADYAVLICRRPELTADRTAAALKPSDEKSLANLWETVRDLIFQVRFGAAVNGTGDHLGKVLFQPRDGYLDGDKPMQFVSFKIERQVYQIGTDTKQQKELLTAETLWRVKLALPGPPSGVTDLAKYWLQA